jgi:hypothetical protein
VKAQLMPAAIPSVISSRIRKIAWFGRVEVLAVAALEVRPPARHTDQFDCRVGQD